MLYRKSEVYKNYLLRRLRETHFPTNDEINLLRGRCSNDLKEIELNIKKYNNKNIPIYDKKVISKLKSNAKISFDYRAEIVDQLVDYIVGIPVDYRHSDENIHAFINEFAEYAELDSLNQETLTDLLSTGHAYRLLYVDEEGEYSAINLDPASTITIDDEKGNAVFAFRFYVELDDNEDEVEVCEFYNETDIYTFKGEGWNLESVEPHLFGMMPVINMYNKKTKQPDFIKVEAQIDALNEIVSNHQDEINEFRNAYMVFKGAKLREEDYGKIIKTGAFEIPEDADVNFLTKKMDVVAVDTQRKMLLENIYRLSKTIDMEKFNDSSESGESRMWKLIMLENRAKQKIIFFRRFLRRMFLVLSTSSAVKGINFDIDDISLQFNRSLPIDEKYTGEALNLYANFVSTRTLLERVPFIDNVDEEIERLREDAKENLRKTVLNNIVNGDGQPVENINNEIKSLQAQSDAKTGNPSTN